MAAAFPHYSRAGTMKRTVSREYFHRIVSGWAYQRWKSKESERRRRDWYQALQELGFDYVFLADANRQLAVHTRAAEIYERHKTPMRLRTGALPNEKLRNIMRYGTSGLVHRERRQTSPCPFCALGDHFLDDKTFYGIC